MTSTSQNGFPAATDRGAIGVKTFAVPGYESIHLAIRADIAPLLLAMARWYFDNVEKPTKELSSWGFASRLIRGSSTTLSNHASGTAIDLNAILHPLGKVGTVPAGKRAAISAKARALGLRWGGDYKGRVDEMHFEVNVNHDKALQLVKALQGGTLSAALGASTIAAAGHPTIRVGSSGQAVRDLQSTLNKWYPGLPKLTVDGQFGPATKDRVMAMQRSRKLTVDGVVGPATWRELGYPT